MKMKLPKLKLPFSSQKAESVNSEEKSVDKTIQDIMPLTGIDGHVLRMKNNSIRSMLEVTSLININLLGTNEQEEVVSGFQSVLNEFEGKRMQVYISSEPMDVADYVAYLEDKIEKEQVSEYRATRLDAEREHVIEHANENRFTKRFYVITGSDLTADDDKLDELREQNNVLIEGFRGIALHSQHLNLLMKTGTEYGRVLFDKINARKSASFGELQNYRLNDMAPHHMFDHDTYYEIDGYFYSTLVFKTYPRDPKAAWLTELYKIKGHVDILIDIEHTGKSKDKVIDDLSNMMGEIETDLARPLSAKEKKQKQRDYDDADLVLDEVLSEEEAAYNVTVYVMVRDETVKGLEKLIRDAESKIRRAKGTTFRLEYEGWDGFFAALPIMYECKLNKRFSNPMHSMAISGMYPFVRTDYQMNTGIRRGINVDNNSLVIVDRMDRSRFVNGNEVTIGISGGGKTSGVEMDILREHSQGFKIRVVTPEPGFNFGVGQFLKVSPANKWVFNPLHISSFIVDKDEDEEDIIHPGEYLRVKIPQIVRWFSWIIEDLTPTERAKLHRKILMTYELKEYNFESNIAPTEFPILEDLARICYKDPDTRRVGELLDPFVNGTYAKMFNGQRNWTMDDMFVANVRDCPLEILPATMELLIQEFWEDAKLNNGNVGVIMDELWYFGDPNRPQTLDFIWEMYKRIRKYNGYANALTQNVVDVMKHPKLTAIINNAVFQRYFKLKEEDAAALSKIVQLTEVEESFIRSTSEPRGTNLFFIGNHRMKTRTSYNLDEMQILNPERFDMIKQVSGDELLRFN